MIFHGRRYGVTLFPGGTVRWFADLAEAESVERVEVAKFAVQDREREAQRLVRLGLQEVARIYAISLLETTPSRRNKKGAS